MLPVGEFRDEIHVFISFRVKCDRNLCMWCLMTLDAGRRPAESMLVRLYPQPDAVAVPGTNGACAPLESRYLPSVLPGWIVTLQNMRWSSICRGSSGLLRSCFVCRRGHQGSIMYCHWLFLCEGPGYLLQRWRQCSDSHRLLVQSGTESGYNACTVQQMRCHCAPPDPGDRVCCGRGAGIIPTAGTPPGGLEGGSYLPSQVRSFK